MKFDDISNNVLYNNINRPIKIDVIILFLRFTFKSAPQLTQVVLKKNIFLK